MTLTKKHDFLISLAIVLCFILANILVGAFASPSNPHPQSDVSLNSSVRSHLLNNPSLAMLPIAVASKDAQVVLSGQVPSTEAAELAAEIAAEVEGVRAVDNQLIVAAEIFEVADSAQLCERKTSGVPKIIRPNT